MVYHESNDRDNDVIMISLNSTTATKIMKIRWEHFIDVHVSEQWILW